MSASTVVLKASSQQEVEKLAAFLAGYAQKGDVILLEGALGAGKSVLCRALIRHFFGCPDMEVPSPSYTLVQEYEQNGKKLFHFDLWRISSEAELYELGWEERELAVVLVEWPQRLGAFTPQEALHINITFTEEETARVLYITGWEDRHFSEFLVQKGFSL